ncbi:MAG: dihydropteroate synthase [Acidaminococcaceae bacterium]
MILPISPCNIRTELENIGVHTVGIALLLNKTEILPLKVLQVRTPAANIIKQEMLGCGGDCAVHAEVITCQQQYCDILLLGTRKHYAYLLKKLAMNPYFGLAKLCTELEAVLSPPLLYTQLADGRKLTYQQMVVMGILNITPDSFYAGSRVSQVSTVLELAGRMLDEGATVLDVGGESSRPGADCVSPTEEIARVVPMLTALRKEYPQSILSIDTYHAATAQAAAEAGVDIINDISAGEADTAMLDVVVKYKLPIILMHMRGTPKNMQQNVIYHNVVEEVTTYLNARATCLLNKGLGKDKVILDPGIGFAKTVKHNLKLMQGLNELTGLGYPILLAASRKSTIGQVLGALSTEERLEGTLATSCQAVYAGAQMVRVHDVQANVRAIRMLEAILKCQ